MIKKQIVLLLGLYFTIITSTAQSYSLNSFEGSRVNINLFYKPSSGMLTISYLRDTILINDYMSIETVSVLNNQFLQINYVKRSGSNEDAMNQLILCVRNGKLCQVLHVNSLTNYDMRPREYSLFKLKISLRGNDVDTYKLTLNIFNKKHSKRNIKTNYKYDKIEVLAFDKKNKVFYSYYETITGYYTFHNLNDNDNGKKYVKKNVPVVKIENDMYYYINGNWFTKDKNDFYSMLL